jgi:hypothetical protein
VAIRGILYRHNVAYSAAARYYAAEGSECGEAKQGSRSRIFVLMKSKLSAEKSIPI